MAQVSKKKILITFYQDILREKLRLKNTLIVGPLQEMGLTFNAGEDQAYTRAEKSSQDKTKVRLKVVLGGELVARMVGLPPFFDDREILKKYIPGIVSAFYALDYHEIGHVKFTDMVCKAIVEYKNPEYIGFMHNLFNILEDYVIEENMRYFVEERYPNEVSPKEFFNYMKKQLFFPKAAEYEEAETASSFLNYLLLLLRVGKKNIKNTNRIFDKYQKDLLPRMMEVLNEEDPTERIYKTISLGEWMIENITELDFKSQTPEETISGSMAGSGSGMARPSKGQSGLGSGLGSALGGAANGGGKGHEGGNEPPTGESENEEEEKEEDEEEKSSSTGSKSNSSGSGSEEDEDEEDEEEEEDGDPVDPENVDVNDEPFEVFDDNNYECDHQWVVAKDDIEIKDLNGLTEAVDAKIDLFKDCIVDISKLFKLFKDRVKPRVEEGHTRGRLNIRRVMNDERIDGCDTRLFNQRIKKGMDTDVIVSQLVDLSGSMSGGKSEAASTAAAAVAQACEYSGVPFECNGFVYDGQHGSVTVNIKSFEDSFEKSKPYFGLLDNSLGNKFNTHGTVNLFWSNQEEDNIYHIWKKLQKKPNKNKLLIVLCDGATCGSRQTLHDIVEQVRNSGIRVVGVGIQDHDVEGIYPETKVFKTLDELREGLAPYLISQLEQYIKY